MGPPNVLQSTATDDTHHQPPPSNDASPSPSTPDAVVPAAYRLSVFDVEFAPEWKFKGSVAIDADITRPVTDFSIHAVGIDASSVQLLLPSADVINLADAVHTSDGLLHVRLPEQLAPGRVTIKIDYQALIGSSMSGFFRARYRTPAATPNTIRDGQDSVVLSTHFEPCYARQAFPCFDEPHLKATFEIDVEAPKELTVLSNMPAKSELELSGDKAGLKKVHFETTPVMSTYLLVWAMADLEYIEGTTENVHGNAKVPVRVYTPPGLVQYAGLALDCAAKVLDLYQKFFSIDYPIAKSDHLVVPEFVSGAMENWGLITYKPTKVLFDPATSNNRVKSKAAYVVAHELAHQWFGNLVTMDSWTELWLNEGFATWAGYTAVDHLYPEWNIWGQYTAEILDDVMKLDSLPTTHPIVNKVDDANAALQMFDQISYFKASSVIRMLADHIGQDAFLSGLTNYLNKHAYKNATSEDLWEALGLVSGVNVSQLMDSWVHIPSFPIARLANEGESRIILQKSILANDAQTASSSWDIPVKLLTGQTAESVSLNAGHVGYLCVDYDAAALSAAINASSTDVSPTDIVGVICDLGTMALNATKPTSHLLDFIWAIRGSRDGFVWLAISRSLTLIRSIFSDDEAILQDLKSFTALLVHDVRDQLTWGNDEAQLGYTEAELCKVLIALGFDTGDASVIREARARFDRWAAGDASALHPSLRGVILASCISNGTPADFDAVKRAFETDPSLDGQEIFLSALGAVRDPAMATALLDYAFAGEDSVPLQHIPLLGSVMGANIRARELQWQYAKDNWARVRARLDRNSTCRDWWIEESFRHLSDPALADDIEAWFRDRSDADTRKQVDYIRASIRRNAAYKQFARDDVAAWLQRKVQA